MKTITFYSYKGGVGRSLALANIANRLSEFKKVCLMDFDLEAPGLPYKFPISFKNVIDKGLVDYVYEFSCKGILPDNISDFSFSFDIGKNKSSLHLIPAGNIESSDYWKKLSSIDWYELLYESKNGLSFFIDLKEKIKKEIKPDFLLIDSRTGISEMSGISISLLADEIVIIAANNKENIEGARKVMLAINNQETGFVTHPSKITLVLSRIPFTNSPKDRAKEQHYMEKMKKDFNDLYKDEIMVIHSDRELEESESLKIGSESIQEKVSISNDYLKLFEHLTKDYLTEDEKMRFQIMKDAEQLYGLAMSKFNRKERIELITQAINLNNTKVEFFIARANAFEETKDYNSAIKDLNHVLSIDENNIDAIDKIAQVFMNSGDYAQAIVYADKLIELTPLKSNGYFVKAYSYCEMNANKEALQYYDKALEVDPNNSRIYNNLGNLYKVQGDYEMAAEYIYKSLELNPAESYSYFTLAEIKAEQNKINEFYLNLELALINKDDSADVLNLINKEKSYKNFFHEERFIKLLEKYNISS